jgi:ATP-dependent RNA circularization protein (DNA/RNA ligase family)
MGPGVQKNREKFSIHRFFVFDIYNITDSRYLSAGERKEVLDIINIYAPQIEHVPVIFSKFTVTEDNADLDMFLRMAERPSINHKIAEGVVFKNVIDGDKSFKVISNKFLLKEE